ncbi:MAG: DUF3300 domain-containing protein [Acidobacteriaceae bacterium]
MTTSSKTVGSYERSSTRFGAAGLLRRGLALSLAYLMVPIGMGDVYGQSYGQEAPPPPDQQYNQPYNQQYGSQYNQPYGQQYGQPNGQYGQPYGQAGYYEPLSPDQLDQLVAPIALYPDALVAQVLAAATYPTQVEDADRWMNSYEGYGPEEVAQMANGMPWDPSVKSLTAFPSVLNNLAQNLDWTTQLGNAYYNQPQDVMEAVQAMRQQAYESGYLRSTPQMYVNDSPEYISILPANPSVVYVPYYDPWNVYGPVIHPWYQYYAPPPPRGVYISGVEIGFGFGISVVAFRHYGWGWGHWDPDWRRHEVYYDHDCYISRSRSVYNRGHFGDFDRHYDRTDFRRDNEGHARGFDRQDQFRGRQNPNFQRAPEYRQFENGRPQDTNRGRQNQNQRQQDFQRNPQYRNLQYRNQPEINHAPQNSNRPQQRFEGRPPQNFHPQPFQGQPPQDINRQPQFRNQNGVNHAPQDFNRPQQQRFEGRPPQNFNRPQPQQNRPQQNFNRGERPQSQAWQFQQRQNNRPQNQIRPADHPHGHADNYDNGHWHGRR